VATTSNIKKNQALSGFTFTMTDSTNHAPVTGLTVTPQVSHDGGAFASTTNAVSELSNGDYKINLSATDLNGNNVMLRFTAVGADDLNILIVTQP
jgi:aminopeptidase-like protein